MNLYRDQSGPLTEGQVSDAIVVTLVAQDRRIAEVARDVATGVNRFD